MNFEHRSLSYHAALPEGKIATRNTKPLDSQEDLSLAYSPGVAGPCREIARDPDLSFRYTARGHLVAVVTNGSAVLGLGNIGPYAAKPVMEGKVMLFKKFADIDGFDLELNCPDPDRFIDAVHALEPTFGGINLEDIKAPDCFYIEEQLRQRMQIPVFHDDQHGTAIITAAAFLNACQLTGRQLAAVRVVFSGAGAAAISCAKLLVTLGVQPEHMIMCDRNGVIHSGRSDLNPYKREWARSTEHRSLADALHAADVFIGVSTANLMTPAMLLSMAADPIVFAMANPDPEIHPDLARATRPDVIMATGRSDFPNQVNNVLGFPYIFRGALDVRATCINEAMKLAAVHAIAALAHEDIPDEVIAVYRHEKAYRFGRDYLIPKPIDQRVLLRVAPAVAEAAMESGVARVQLDLDEYRHSIEKILGPTRRLIRTLRTEAASFRSKCGAPLPRLVLTRGEEPRMLRAAAQIASSGEAQVILLGSPQTIAAVAKENGVSDLERFTIIDPHSASPQRDSYADGLYRKRQRRGVSRTLASSLIQNHSYFATMMVHRGDADGMLAGLKESYPEAVRPIFQLIARRPGTVPVGVYMLVLDGQARFFADCSIHADPDAAQLAAIALTAAHLASEYTDDPVRVAMLSFASFGSSRHPNARKVADAVALVREQAPHLEIDGEMQADVALNPRLREAEFPFSTLSGSPNVLIFPDLGAANIAYKLLSASGERPVPTGPILAGFEKPAHAVQRTATVSEIVNMAFVIVHQVARQHARVWGGDTSAVGAGQAGFTAGS